MYTLAVGLLHFSALANLHKSFLLAILYPDMQLTAFNASSAPLNFTNLTSIGKRVMS